MPLETSLLALPVADLAIIGGLALLGCVAGWQARRLATRSGDAALKRGLLDAKSAVPQLESAARQQEHRAEALVLELRALKERLSEYEATARQKEHEIAKRDREIRSLGSELKILKDGSGSAGQVILEGEFVDAEPTTDDPEMAKRYAALEARYDALAQGLFQRDDRIAELEAQLKNPGSEVPTRTLEQEVCELEQTSDSLKAALKEREEQLQALQTRLQEETTQREAFEDLAKRRSEGNRDLKSAAAKFEQQIPSLKETIKARDGQIAERDGKLVSLNRAFRDEKQQREAREAEIKDLQAQASAMSAQQRDLEERIQQRDAAYATLEGELRNTTDMLRASETTVGEREATIADVEGRLATANERFEAGERTAATLQGSIKDRDFKIAELETAANRQAAKLEMLRSTFFEAKASHDQHVADLTRRHDEQRERLESRISEQQLTLADRELEVNELTGTAGELARVRQKADALARQVGELTEAMARSNLALRQRQCAVLLLVARLGATPLLLPGPVASDAKEVDGCRFEPLPRAEVA